MIRWAFPVARWRGTPVLVHWTFAVLFVLLVGLTGRRSGTGAAAGATVLFLGLTASVILHELGHVAVARRTGLTAREVVLYPFGGVTLFVRPLRAGRQELAVSLAGPLVNLGLGAALLVLSPATAPWWAMPGDPAFSLPRTLGAANLALALINLVPVLPLDGGRLLRSLLTPSLGEVGASRLVGNLGQATGLTLMILGTFVSAWLTVFGLVLFLGALGELQRLQPLLLLKRQTVDDLLNPRIEEIPPGEPVAGLRERQGGSPSCDYVIVDGGRPVGFIPAARLLAADDVRPDAPAADLALPLAEPVRTGTPLEAAAAAAAPGAARHAPVVDEHGRLLGVLSLASVQRSAALLAALGSARRRAEKRGRRGERQDHS